MIPSPGHRQWPEHRIAEQRLTQRMKAAVDGEIVADSTDVIRVKEDGSPERYYFPRADVRMEQLTRTDTTTTCPFKGVAHYYSLSAAGQHFGDAVWTYEDPYLEHADLKDRLAFYDDKYPDIEVGPA